MFFAPPPPSKRLLLGVGAAITSVLHIWAAAIALLVAQPFHAIHAAIGITAALAASAGALALYLRYSRQVARREAFWYGLAEGAEDTAVESGDVVSLVTRRPHSS